MEKTENVRKSQTGIMILQSEVLLKHKICGGIDQRPL